MSGAPRGYQEPAFSNSEFDAHRFMVRSLLTRVRTAILVEVVTVSNVGAVVLAGLVDLAPLTNQVDGAGNVVPHGIIHGCPYIRLQGGANAVIIDPVVGDIGLAVFADRDISAVIATGKRSNPGSARQHDMADGLYLGGYLNAVPTQTVAFAADGITLSSPVAVTINAPSIVLTGAVAATGTLTSNGHDVSSTHRHSGVSGGTGNSGPPL